MFFVDHSTQKTTWTDPRTLQRADSIIPAIPDGKLNSAKSTPGWACRVCTFNNENNVETCAMCGEGRFRPTEANQKEARANENSGQELTDPWQLQPYMVPDENSDHCFACKTKFNWRNRRHHCKSCGLLFCANCSQKQLSFVVGLEDDKHQEKERRVCDMCANGIEECIKLSGETRLHVPLFRMYSVLLSDARSTVKNIAVTGILQLLQGSKADEILRTLNAYIGLSFFSDFVAMSDLQPSETACDVLYSSFEILLSQGNSENIKSMLKDTTMISTMKAVLIEGSSISLKSRMCRLLAIVGHEIQDTVRNETLFPSISELLLSPNEDAQEWSCRALNSLVFNCGDNVDELLKCNGVQSLVLLLSNMNESIQENAAASLVTIFSIQQQNVSEANMNKLRVDEAKRLFMNLGGLENVVEKVMTSRNANVSKAGAKLLLLFSKGAEAQFMKASGAIPRIISLLGRDHDLETKSAACRVLLNIASLGTSERHTVVTSGTLPLIHEMIKSENMAAIDLYSCLCEDVDCQTFALEHGLIQSVIPLIESNPSCKLMPLLLSCLSSEHVHVRNKVIEIGGLKPVIDLLVENTLSENFLGDVISVLYTIFGENQTQQHLVAESDRSKIVSMLLQVLENRAATLCADFVEKAILIIGTISGMSECDLYDVMKISHVSSPLDTKLFNSGVQNVPLSIVHSVGMNALCTVLKLQYTNDTLSLSTLKCVLAVMKHANMEGVEKFLSSEGIHSLYLLSERIMKSSEFSCSDICKYIIAIVYLVCCQLQNVKNVNRYIGKNDGGFMALLKNICSRIKTEDRIERSFCLKCLCQASHSPLFWDCLSDNAIQPLIDVLMEENHSSGDINLILDIGLLVQTLCVLEKNADIVLASGGIFGFVRLLSEPDEEAILCGIRIISVLATSSTQCCAAILNESVDIKLIQLCENQSRIITHSALECLLSMLQPKTKGRWNAASHSAILTTQNGSNTDAREHISILFRIYSSPDVEIKRVLQDLFILLASSDNKNFWIEIVTSKHTDIAINLLSNTPSITVSNACSAIQQIISLDPMVCPLQMLKLSLFPVLPALLRPDDRLGANTSIIPFEDAACLISSLSGDLRFRSHILNRDIILSFIHLLLRERRLGRLASTSGVISPILRSALHCFYFANFECEVKSSSSEGFFWGIILSESAQFISGDNTKHKVLEILTYAMRKIAYNISQTNATDDEVEIFSHCCDLFSVFPSQIEVTRGTLLEPINPILGIMKTILKRDNQVNVLNCAESCVKALKRVVSGRDEADHVIAKRGVTVLISWIGYFHSMDDTETRSLIFALASLLDMVASFGSSEALKTIEVSSDSLVKLLGCLTIRDSTLNVVFMKVLCSLTFNKTVCKLITESRDTCRYFANALSTMEEENVLSFTTLKCVCNIAEHAEFRQALVLDVIKDPVVIFRIMEEIESISSNFVIVEKCIRTLFLLGPFLYRIQYTNEQVEMLRKTSSRILKCIIHYLCGAEFSLDLCAYMNSTESSFLKHVAQRDVIDNNFKSNLLLSSQCCTLALRSVTFRSMIRIDQDIIALALGAIKFVAEVFLRERPFVVCTLLSLLAILYDERGFKDEESTFVFNFLSSLMQSVCTWDTALHDGVLNFFETVFAKDGLLALPESHVLRSQVIAWLDHCPAILQSRLKFLLLSIGTGQSIAAVMHNASSPTQTKVKAGGNGLQEENRDVENIAFTSKPISSLSPLPFLRRRSGEVAAAKKANGLLVLKASNDHIHAHASSHGSPPILKKERNAVLQSEDDAASIRLALKLQAEENKRGLPQANAVSKAGASDASVALALKLQAEENASLNSSMKSSYKSLHEDARTMPPPPAYTRTQNNFRNEVPQKRTSVEVNCGGCGVLLRVPMDAKGVRCPKHGCGKVTMLP